MQSGLYSVGSVDDHKIEDGNIYRWEKNCNLDALFKLQKRYCRLMMFSGFVAPSRPLFVQLGLLNIYQIYKYQLAIYMYKILLKHKQVPLLNHQLFSTGSSIHSYDTRFKIDLYKQACWTKLRQSTICFQGPRLWNNLPESMKLSSSLTVFRKNLKLFCYHSMTVTDLAATPLSPATPLI